MKLELKHGKAAIALTAVAVATAAIAATLIQLDAPVVVSTSDAANNAYKAKMGWISYKSDPAVPQYDVKAQLLVYADGPAGAQNIWIARSIDNGATWTQTKVTNNGGNAISVTDPVTTATEAFTVTNNKPNIFVPPIGVLNAGKGADALLTWTSSDCEGVATQKINTNLVPLTGHNQPYMCLWAARSVNGGTSWSLQRLTDGSMDPDEDVPAGSVQYTTDTASTGHFAITFQADPKGLQLGDAEGSGDGASGANVSPGTNIWYTYLSKTGFEAGTAFPAPVQVSDNNDTATGMPGASRANLAISGSTAVIAYEETKGDGTSGKQIIYHNFPASSYPNLDNNKAGTGISNTANNARRVRFLLQGNEALDTAGDKDGDAADGDTKGVHVMLLWRETTLTTPAAASDVVVRRGIKNTALRGTLSTGFAPADVLADTAINLSDPTAASLTDNSLAQRGVLRGDFAAIAYDMTPDKAAADAYTATYNLYMKRSTDGGNTWGAARNLSNITNPALRVVEPRLVGTPGTIKLPTAVATSDTTDVQNRNVMFASWGTETNSATPVPQDIYLTRSTDQGATFETVQLLAGDGGATLQASEAQLRSPPDGKTLGALWMQKSGTATDVIYRNGTEGTVPDPVVPPVQTSTSSSGGCTTATGQAPFDPMLPALAALGLIGLGLRRARRS
ncbi:MAG: choice-of-anchor O protein [Rhodoferax sp.]|nr:choice-of-anchor O protein [Rhodoferax sp.]